MSSTTLPQYRTRPLPDGTLAWRETGVGAPVVLLHGVGMQSAAWGPQIDALSTTHRVIALDLPGHGKSSRLAARTPHIPELPDYVSWLHKALNSLALQKNITLIGHSMGALITAGCATTSPDRLARVALLNGVFRRPPAARAAVIQRAEQIRSGAFDLNQPLSRWFTASEADQNARAMVAKWLKDVHLDGYSAAYGAFARGDTTYADRLCEIRCPLLAITGDDDPNSTPEMSTAMASAAPNGRAVTIPGHRHMVNLTAPDAVNAALLNWINSDEGALT